MLGASLRLTLRAFALRACLRQSKIAPGDFVSGASCYPDVDDSPEGMQKEAEVTGKIPPAYKTEGDIKKGFVCKRVPHVTLKSIANNPDIKEGMTREQIDAAIAQHADVETLFDQPYEDKKRLRVSGPFTVESLSPTACYRRRTRIWTAPSPSRKLSVNRTSSA